MNEIQITTKFSICWHLAYCTFHKNPKRMHLNHSRRRECYCFIWPWYLLKRCTHRLFFFLLLFVCLMHIGGNLWVFNPRQSFKADQYISAIWIGQPLHNPAPACPGHHWPRPISIPFQGLPSQPSLGLSVVPRDVWVVADPSHHSWPRAAHFSGASPLGQGGRPWPLPA